MKKYNGALILIALTFLASMLLSLYNGGFNWKFDLLGPIILMAIIYAGSSYYERNKNKDLAKEIDNTAIQMNKAVEELEKSVGKVESFESEKLALLKKQQELENKVAELKEEGEEREETIKKLEEIKEKNKNAVQNYYLFNEEMVKVNNRNLRIMTRYKFKDLNATKPMYVDCYIDFNKIAKLDLVDLNLGTANSDFKIDKKYIDRCWYLFHFSY